MLCKKCVFFSRAITEYEIYEYYNPLVKIHHSTQTEKIKASTVLNLLIWRFEFLTIAHLSRLIGITIETPITH